MGLGEKWRANIIGEISVNGTPAHIGQRIAHSDQVRVNGRLLKVKIDPPPIRVLAYHKPVGRSFQEMIREQTISF